MNEILIRNKNRKLRANRVRARVSGTANRPRLAVSISNRNIIAQVIDDEAGKTIAYATTANNKQVKGSLATKAEWVGSEIAKSAKSKKVKTVVFDRSRRLYHGRIKILADAARKGGLEF